MDESPSPRLPNIVVIVADDLGYDDVGYRSAVIRSPHIDKLVESGVQLENFYVQPQCTPTRVAILTGRYPSRFGTHVTQANNTQALAFGTPTLASALQSTGYKTGIVGKWHLGSKPEWGPLKFGFQESYGALAGAIGVYDHRYRLTQPQYTNTWHRNDELIPDEPGHHVDLVAAEAESFIERHADEPFFLYLPFFATHVPLQEPEDWLNKVAHIENPDRRLFAATVAHMDHAIGRVVEALDKAEIRDNTVIWFTSDNGGLNNHGGNTYPPPDPKLRNFSSNKPLRGQKTEVYEGGMRVPAFVSWPGHLEPRVVNAPMHAVDIMPTLMNLVGASVEPTPDFDGQNVWPVIKSGTPPTEPRDFYWVQGAGRQRIAMRSGDWKLLRNGTDQAFQLFNIAEDPNETNNLADEMPERVAELKAMIEAEKKSDRLVGSVDG
jgi:arylsulfatase A-like enzyme